MALSRPPLRRAVPWKPSRGDRVYCPRPGPGDSCCEGRVDFLYRDGTYRIRFSPGPINSDATRLRVPLAELCQTRPDGKSQVAGDDDRKVAEKKPGSRKVLNGPVHQPAEAKGSQAWKWASAPLSWAWQQLQWLSPVLDVHRDGPTETKAAVVVWETGDLDLRQAVSHLKTMVWANRGYRDIYLPTVLDTPATTTVAEQPKALTVALDGVAAVDHILEIQMFNLAWNSSRGHLPASASRRQDHKTLVSLVNGLGNLNVTSEQINLAKKWPISRCLARMRQYQGRLRTKPLAEVARVGIKNNPTCASAKTMQRLLDDGSWQRIEQAMLDSHDLLLGALADSRSTLHEYAPFVQTWEDLIQRFKLGEGC